MLDYKRYAEERFQDITPDDIKVFYNDDGVYVAVWSEYGALRPDTFIPFLGDPVPCDTEEEFMNFLSSIKYAHNRTGKDGKVYEVKGTKLFPEPLSYIEPSEGVERKWKYRTNRVP